MMTAAERIMDTFNTLHHHPEISWEEQNTTRYLAELLAEYDCRVTAFADHTGVIGELGQGRPVVAVRADIDALRQMVDGELRAVHSCGHDAHMSMAIGALHELKQQGELPAGTIRFIFQPAEEQGNGALRLVDAGVADDVDYLFGVHLRPIQELPTGVAAPAIVHGAGCFLKGRIIGEDLHAARPHLGVNAIEVGAALVQMIGGIRLDPAVPHSAKLTSFEAGGQSPNIIPGSASFGIDLRAQTNEMFSALLQAVEQKMKAASALYGGVRIETEQKALLPAAEVDPDAKRILASAITSVLGPGALAPPVVTPGGDDFHYYTIRRPRIKAAMLGLGCNLSPGLHHPKMTFDHDMMIKGAAILSKAVTLTFREGEGA